MAGVVEKYPWLEQHLQAKLGEGSPGSGVSSSSEESEEGGETPNTVGELTDEAVEGVFEELYRKRVEWFTEPPWPRA